MPLADTQNLSTLNAELYRRVNEFAQLAPSWVHTLAEIGTDAGLLIFAAIFLLNWWRARHQNNRSIALSFLGPTVAVSAYAISAFLKSLVREERPCNVMPGLSTVVDCPPSGDWSLPSNHATIAAACAAAIILARPRLAYFVVPLAALIAFSRIFVGVHYPYDVMIGLLLGVISSTLLTLILSQPFTAIVGRLRR